MGTQSPRSVVLDTGALIAIERLDEKMTALLQASLVEEVRFFVPAGVLAQAWRDGERQSRLARFLKKSSVEVVPLSEAQARAAGQLCGASGTRDVIDASVVICARRYKCAVVAGDEDDLRALDASMRLHVI
jgi:hypothetical protein